MSRWISQNDCRRATSTTKLTHSIRLANSLLPCSIKNAPRFARRSIMKSNEAATFYLQAVVAVHSEKRVVLKMMGHDGSLTYVEAVKRLIAKKERTRKKSMASASASASLSEEEFEGGRVLEQNNVEASNSHIQTSHILFPPTKTTLDDENFHEVGWMEPFELLASIASELFSGLGAWINEGTVEELKETMFDMIRANTNKHRMTNVDDMLWHVMQCWSSIVRLRMLRLRRLTRTTKGVENIKTWVSSITEWKKMCSKKLGCNGKTFNTCLQERDREEMLFAAFHEVILRSEQGADLVEAFEKAVIPTVTVDLGGAKNKTTPLTLHSDAWEDKRKKTERAARQSSEHQEIQERMRLEKLSFAEKAREKQGQGGGGGGRVEGRGKVAEKEDENDGNCVFVCPVSSLLELSDCFACYEGKVGEWFAQQGEGQGEDIDSCKSRFAQLKESLKSVESRAGGGGVSEGEEKQLRLLVEGLWSRLRVLISDIGMLSGIIGKGKGGEFLQDVWINGERVRFTSKTKLIQWAS